METVWKEKLAYDTNEPRKQQQNETSLQDVPLLTYLQGKTGSEH